MKAKMKLDGTVTLKNVPFEVLRGLMAAAFNYECEQARRLDERVEIPDDDEYKELKEENAKLDKEFVGSQIEAVHAIRILMEKAFNEYIKKMKKEVPKAKKKKKSGPTRQPAF